jgi:hypothetical protein
MDFSEKISLVPADSAAQIQGPRQRDAMQRARGSRRAEIRLVKQRRRRANRFETHTTLSRGPTQGD